MKVGFWVLFVGIVMIFVFFPIGLLITIIGLALILKEPFINWVSKILDKIKRQ